MYVPTPNLAELKAAGLTLEDVATSTEIWLVNLPAYNLFVFMSTQWRTGVNGPTGLDFNIAYAKMARMKLSDEEYDELESDLKTMEAAALSEIHRKKD